MGKDTKNLIKELVAEVLEEMTATGAVTGYMTPNAFRGKHSKHDVAARSMPGGKVVGKEDETDDTTITEDTTEDRLPIVRQDGKIMEEGRSRYRNFKESDLMRNHAKISYGINEAKKMLKEVEYLLNICERLKTECDIPTNNLWKKTKPNMVEIHKRMKAIANRIHKIGK